MAEIDRVQMIKNVVEGPGAPSSIDVEDAQVLLAKIDVQGRTIAAQEFALKILGKKLQDQRTPEQVLADEGGPSGA